MSIGVSTRVRPCAVCGTFYSGDERGLRRQIDALFGGPSSPPGKVAGLIAPHAGYVYSGATAATGYRLLRGARYDGVVVVSPSHREFFDGVSVFGGAAYDTPLGRVPVDPELRDALLAILPPAAASDAGHRGEHAVEVQLPFLQAALGVMRFLPLVVGNQSREICNALGDALATLAGRSNLLLVASTDLSHYFPSTVARRLDAVMIEDVRAMDHQALMTHLEEKSTEACGGGPAVSVLRALAARGVRRMEILDHRTSGDVTGDHSSVVGYLCAAAYA